MGWFYHMYWHGTYCIYSMVPIYLFLLYILGRYLFIAAASVGMYHGGNLDLYPSNQLNWKLRVDTKTRNRGIK